MASLARKVFAPSALSICVNICSGVTSQISHAASSARACMARERATSKSRAANASFASFIRRRALKRLTSAALASADAADASSDSANGFSSTPSPANGLSASPDQSALSKRLKSSPDCSPSSDRNCLGVCSPSFQFENMAAAVSASRRASAVLPCCANWRALSINFLATGPNASASEDSV